MTITNFQAESKHSGDLFESQVLEDLGRFGQQDIRKNVVVKDVGCEVDFAYDFRGTQVYVEAKGGLQGEGKRPGAKRTDNVKKAIANAALIKSRYPETQYIVYFSDLPKYGSSSHKMLKTAVRAGFIDSVRYLIDIVR
jgi:hypothetical protein